MARRTAPAHLSRKTKAWWHDVIKVYELDEHHIKLLTLACEAWDRAVEAREALNGAGLTFDDRFGQPRARPEVGIERDSRLAFAKLLRELDLDRVPPPAPSRPPRI